MHVSGKALPSLAQGRRTRILKPAAAELAHVGTRSPS
jgi:hypothetical protein